MKKVLFITYHFPPSGGASTRRTLKFLKYMLLFSWNPVILTSRSLKYSIYDPSLIYSIPKYIKVHRVSTFSYIFFKIIKRKKYFEQIKNTHNKSRDFYKLQKNIFRSFLIFLKSILVMPDVFILWAPFAIFKGMRLLQKEKFDAIYATGPPFSNHIIAVFLKKLSQKPLIVDFRDAWVSEPVRVWKYPKIRRQIEAVLERMVINNADCVLSTTEGVTHDFGMRYPAPSTQKFITLPNGYDREEFNLETRYDGLSSDKLRIVHTGHLRLERSPKSFLEALRLLLDERPDIENKMSVYLIGENHRFIDGKMIDDYIAEYRLENMLNLTGHISRDESIKYQIEADLLLLIIGVVPKNQISTYGVASKVFDYMMAKRPVLTLAHPGPVSTIIQETNLGPVIDPADVNGIKQYLHEAFEAYSRGELVSKSNNAAIEKYDFKKLTEHLTGIFNTCVASQT